MISGLAFLDCLGGRAVSACALAGILLLAGCRGDAGTDALGPEETPPPASLQVVSGDRQLGSTGQVLPEPIRVRVGDASGNPLSGIRVTFELVRGGGTLSAAEGETDSEGMTWTEWTLGEGPTHSLRIWVGEDPFQGLRVRVTATNTDVLLLEVNSGEGQTGAAGETLPDPVVVSVRDCHGELQPEIPLSFQVTRGGGELDLGVATTDPNGLAAVSWTVGKGPINELSATVSHPTLRSAPLLVEARTELDLTFEWVQGLAFPVWLGQDVPSDGRTLESNRFLTFSDAASDTSKLTFATLAERGLGELLQDFAIDSAEEIGIRSEERLTKWTIYTNCYLTGIGQRSFRWGFFLYGSESAIYDEWWGDAWWGEASELFRREIKHETMHVLQMALADPQSLGAADNWFNEGLAEYVSGGVLPTYSSYDQVEEFLRRTGVTRLLSVRPEEWWGLPMEEQDMYYSMFHLAVEYLLSEDGFGKTLMDVKGMLQDMAAGTDFDTAFRRAMGFTVEQYDTEFYPRIRLYFEEQGAP